MNRNPYSPPEASVSDPRVPEEIAHVPAGSNALYSPNQIFAAAFIGSPIAAAWFAASNFRALGQSIQARHIILWGVLATAVVMGVAFVLPDGTPNIALPLAYSLAIRALAENLFKSVVQDHANAGGRSGSWWRVTGISILWLLLVCACIAGIVITLDQFGLLSG